MDKREDGAFYTVMIDLGTDEGKIPYSVFAKSDFHAARIVKNETGYLASQHEVEGPYTKF